MTTYIEIPCGADAIGNPYVRRMKVEHLSFLQRIELRLLGWKTTTQNQ